MKKQDKAQRMIDYRDQLKATGRKEVVTRWLKAHQILGHVQKEARHNIDKLTDELIVDYCANLDDWHIV